MAGEGKRNKARGNRHEARVAARRDDRRRVPMSGAGAIKGDVISTYELIQCKSSSQYAATLNGRGSKVIGVKLSDLKQMLAEQALEQKPIGILHLHYKGESRDWVVMSEEQYEEMLAAWEVVRNGRGQGEAVSDGVAGVDATNPQRTGRERQ